MQEKEAVWQEIRNRVFQNMDLSGEISDKELKRMITEEVRQFGKVHLLSLQARETCEEQILILFGSWISYRNCWMIRRLLRLWLMVQHIFFMKNMVCFTHGKKGSFRKNGYGI